MNEPLKPELPKDPNRTQITEWMTETEQWIRDYSWSLVDMEREYAHSFIVLAEALGVRIAERQ